MVISIPNYHSIYFAENDNTITPTKTSGGVKVDECKSKTKKEQCSFPALDDTTLRNITSPSQNTSCGAIAEEGTPVGSPSTPEQSSLVYA